MTPTQRTLAELRKRGYLAEVVEKWNPYGRDGFGSRKDLFGFIEVLALRDDETLAVQTTSASNVSARVKKIADADALSAVRKAGWYVVVHGWRKNAKGRWVLREVDVS